MKWERTEAPEAPGWCLKEDTTGISVWDTGTGEWKAEVTDTVVSPGGFVVITGQATASQPRPALAWLVATIANKVPSRVRDVVQESLRVFPG